ncbi:DEAD/DEAH box helicase [Corynebacterium pilosum]|uniref:DEAD/DEAH box helicase n=1 Tax=Corynebacterium pilosum TaxID=35756 RepID=UPI000A660FFC
MTSGTSGPSLRVWQQEALDKFLSTKPKDFLAVATPGSGKTTFALTLASTLVADKTVQRVIVVVPTEHLKFQWSDAAKRFGLALDPKFTNSSAVNPAYDGIVVTYAR